MEHGVVLGTRAVITGKISLVLAVGPPSVTIARELPSRPPRKASSHSTSAGHAKSRAADQVATHKSQDHFPSSPVATPETLNLVNPLARRSHCENGTTLPGLQAEGCSLLL